MTRGGGGAGRRGITTCRVRRAGATDPRGEVTPRFVARGAEVRLRCPVRVRGVPRAARRAADDERAVERVLRVVARVSRASARDRATERLVDRRRSVVRASGERLRRVERSVERWRVRSWVRRDPRCSVRWRARRSVRADCLELRARRSVLRWRASRLRSVVRSRACWRASA